MSWKNVPIYWKLDYNKIALTFFSSVQFSHSVVSDSLRPHESQHARPPCLSPTPAVYSNSCPSSWWCHPAMSSSVIPFSSCLQSLPASGSFPMSTRHMMWPKYWSFSFSISPSNEHPGLISFRMDWLGLLEVQKTLKSLLQHHSSKASIFRLSAFFTVQLSHPYMTTGKTIALTKGFSYCSYCSWGSKGKNTEVVCHSLFQWTIFCQKETVWKGRKIGYWRWTPQAGRCPICYWRSVEK